jgi:hypothetical protein
MALYVREEQKQIFIAFDKEGNYDKEIQSIIKENTVLRLGADEQALYGRQWGRKDATK